MVKVFPCYGKGWGFKSRLMRILERIYLVIEIILRKTMKLITMIRTLYENNRTIFQRIWMGIKVGYYDLKLKVNLQVLVYLVFLLAFLIMFIYIILIDPVAWALDNEGGPEGPEVPDDSPSPSSSEDTGYETDSNRSYLEQGADAMMQHPVQDIPDQYLERYIENLGEIAGDPEYWDTPEERQIFVDRQQELQDELDKRNPDSRGAEGDAREESSNKGNTEEGSSNKDNAEGKSSK